MSATHRRFPQITSLIIHTERLSLAWTSTDFPLMSGICRQFFKTCRWVKNRAKIVLCKLGISGWGARICEIEARPLTGQKLASHRGNSRMRIPICLSGERGGNPRTSQIPFWQALVGFPAIGYAAPLPPLVYLQPLHKPMVMQLHCVIIKRLQYRRKGSFP